MKAVILAGGFGTRISEESAVRPKPLVEVGGHPILWHVMKIYAAHGIDDFVIAAGYRGWMIKEYFASYALNRSDVTFDLAGNRVTLHPTAIEPWTVSVVDTGEGTMTGGRLRRVADWLDDETFCLAYGDCVGDVDVGRAIALHRDEGTLATLTAVQPPGRFGVVHVDEGHARIASFTEKPQGDGGWVNGGFFVLEPGVLDYVDDDATVWERDSLERLARDDQLSAYRHGGFWQPMDTLRDKMVLEELWASGSPPWRIWEPQPA